MSSTKNTPESKTEELEQRIEELEKQTKQSSSAMSPWFHLYVVMTSIAAAVSLLSLFRDFIKLHQFFTDIVNAWTIIVQPITKFLFSWVFEIFGFTMPLWLGDYLIIGLIITAGRLRADYHRFNTYRDLLYGFYSSTKFYRRIVVTFILWPLYILEQVYRAYIGAKYKYHIPWSIWLYLLLSPFAYFIILLIANYTAFFIWTGTVP